MKTWISKFLLLFFTLVLNYRLSLLDQLRENHGKQWSDPETSLGSCFLSFSTSLNTTQVLQAPGNGSRSEWVGSAVRLSSCLICLRNAFPADGQLDLEIQVNVEFVPETTTVGNARGCAVLYETIIFVLSVIDFFACTGRISHSYSIILLRL